MASPSELSLDCKPHSYSMLLKSFGDLHHQSSSSDHHQNQNQNQTYKLEEFLSRLEEERLKIDAFKRELPLCMQLLTNAMEASRQQLQAFRVNQQQGGTAIRPVLEEFIPIKHSNCSDQISSSSDQKAQNMMSDNKANWMTSAQLWSQTTEAATKQQQQPTLTSSPKESHPHHHHHHHHHHHDIGFNVSPKLVLENKHRNGGGGGGGGGGAFLPFSKESRSSTSSSLIRGLPELALASSEKEMMILDNNDDKKCAGEITENIKGHNKRENSSGNNNNNNDGVVVDQGKSASPVASHAQTSTATTTTTTTTSTNTTQTHRKARRCWSPDLHRRFVNALQMLGGSQVATPKQIRELMKVDGLTNDEVKSHLQKYRLHTRRPSPSPQAGAPAPQLVVLGGIWVPPEYATAAAAAPALYGAHHPAPPPHYCAATPVPQEFYTAAPPQPLLPPPPPPHHNGSLHHHLHVYKAAAGHGQSSPESEVGGGGERSESIEDGKSESSSWKGESEGERKGLNEESNGSDITLKF